MQDTRILIIDDEAPIREVLSASLKDEGYQVFTAHDGETGLKAINEYDPQIVFLDIWMPGTLDGIEVLTKGRTIFPHVDFIMISGHGTIETAVRATKLGAFDFIEKPLSMDKILISIQNIINLQQERRDKNALLNRLRTNIAMIGDSESLVSLKQMVTRVAPTQAWVLISGENGVGKELLAQNIHYLSPRASRAFVEVNCAAISEDLIESELFGFEKGAFAGVDRQKRGKIDLAQGGTLFLDEVSSLNLKTQGKLLRLLEEKKFQRVGGASDVEVDIRVIASTTKDLEVEIKEGRFREDLFYRLNVVPFRIPALRERKQDVSALVTHFSDYYAKESGLPRKQFSEGAIHVMESHAWSGNVRELRNFIERVYILTPGDFVDIHDLRFAGLGLPDGDTATVSTDMANFREARAEFEKIYLVKKLSENSGNISRTAEVIGLERSYLHRKIKAYNIEAKDTKD